MVALLNLVNNLDGEVLVPTPIFTTIMVAQSTNSVLYLLLVSAVPPFKRSCGFPNVLTFTSIASSQVDNEGTVTGQILSDGVNFLGVGTLKC